MYAEIRKGTATRVPVEKVAGIFLIHVCLALYCTVCTASLDVALFVLCYARVLRERQSILNFFRGKYYKHDCEDGHGW